MGAPSLLLLPLRMHQPPPAQDQLTG